MNILVLGAYGIFGTRLCELLAGYRQLHLFVAGRNLSKAQALCDTLSGVCSREPVRVDRERLVPDELRRMQIDIVIDASGPFQAYDGDIYHVVKTCLDAAVNYLDFADGADFVHGISAFDEEARLRGIFVLSGVSSFPVLTAAVVRSLTHDMPSVECITACIAPSPFAIVGKNVIRAIAGYAGQPVRLVREGQAAIGHALTETRSFTIAPPGRLPLAHIRFSLVDVPDLRVLPRLWPGLQGIWMGAGPTPEILHRMLNGLASLVKRGIVPTLSPFSMLFFHAINLLRWGEHRGGMLVEVAGLSAARQPIRRTWHMLAEGDDGPYIPCIALQAIVQRTLASQPPRSGARPATDDLELADYNALFAQRTIHTGVRNHGVDEQVRGPFEAVLGTAFHNLPDTLQAVHRGAEQSSLEGVASVQRGRGIVAKAIAAWFGFPATDPSVAVTIHMQRHGATELWQRTFGRRGFASKLSAGTGRGQWLLVEQFGLFRFYIALVFDDGRLNWIVRRVTFCGLGLPRMIIPRGTTYEHEVDGLFHFHVEVVLPVVGLVVRYAGWLKSVRHPSQASSLQDNPGEHRHS